MGLLENIKNPLGNKTPQQLAASQLVNVPGAAFSVFPIERNTFLRVSVSTVQAVTIAVNGLIYSDRGKGLYPFGPVPLTPTATDGTIPGSNILIIPLTAGVLTNVRVVSLTGGAESYPLTWVAIELQSSPSTSATPYVTLGSGPLNATFPLVFPPFVMRQPRECASALTLVQPGNPAAGAQISVAYGASLRVRFNSVSAKLTTDATAAVRKCGFAILDTGGNIIFATPVSGNGQNPSTSKVYLFAPTNGNGQDQTLGTGGQDFEILFSPLMLYPFIGPFTLVSYQNGTLGPADQWSNIRICQEQWLEI